MGGIQEQAAETESSTTRPIVDLFAALEGPLLLYARQIGADPETAQDLVQEAFMRLHSHFKKVQQPRAWLYRTVHNLAMNHHRAARRIVAPVMVSEDPNAAPPDPVDPNPLPDQQLQRLEAVGLTRQCLEKLPARDQELIRLKFEENLSYLEMSRRTGLSVGHVGYCLHHALKALARKLEKTGVIL